MPNVRKILQIRRIPNRFWLQTKNAICRRCRPTGGFALVGGDAKLRFYGGGGGGIDLGKIGSPKGFPAVTISAMAKVSFVPDLPYKSQVDR